MTKKYGHVLLLDLHSYFLCPVTDVCLGNCNGSTCSERIISFFKQAFRAYDFSVAKNEVLTGGYITRHYCGMPDVESLQVELRFPAYLAGEYFGEAAITEWECDKFRNAKSRLHKVFNKIIKGLS